MKVLPIRVFDAFPLFKASLLIRTLIFRAWSCIKQITMLEIDPGVVKDALAALSPGEFQIH